jgi:hypothetical protein
MKILYISAVTKNTLSDYMCDLTLHGLRDLYGNDVIDYPGCWHLYADEVKKRNFDTNTLWGKGFTLNNSLSGYDLIDRSNIKQKIKSRYFDLIIYGSIRKSSHFIDEVIDTNNRFIFIDGEDDTFIDEKYSNKSLYFKREILREYNNIKPVNFSIPKNNIIKEINLKPKNLISPLIPGRPETYIYDNEEDYNKMYQDSVFAITTKKSGWDCLRHYEILANGCIPFFLDIKKCPSKTLDGLPKDLLIEILKKYEWILSQYNPFYIYKKKSLNLKKIISFLISQVKSKKNIENFINNNSEIFDIKKKLLDFTKDNLTTECIAKKIIEESKIL